MIVNMHGTTAVQAPPMASWRVADVARYFGVTPSAVYKWVYQGLIPVHRTPGGGLRFVEFEVKTAQPTEKDWHGRKGEAA